MPIIFITFAPLNYNGTVFFVRFFEKDTKQHIVSFSGDLQSTTLKKLQNNGRLLRDKYRNDDGVRIVRMLYLTDVLFFQFLYLAVTFWRHNSGNGVALL